jgi:uncharacterized protein YdhG (YjbR/CyaY superfamily)
MPDTKTSTKQKRAPRKSAGNVWTDEERAAMQASAAERKTSSRRGPMSEAEERARGEQEVRDRIAGMPEPDRTMARRVHELVTTSAPNLVPRTYYGMPAYARDGKTICFFKAASKFKERYATFGFEQNARLDDGTMWPTSFALTTLTAADEERIAELVKKAAG